jgi:hypothetical protein
MNLKQRCFNLRRLSLYRRCLVVLSRTDPPLEGALQTTEKKDGIILLGYYFIWQLASLLHSDLSLDSRTAQRSPQFHSALSPFQRVLIQYTAVNTGVWGPPSLRKMLDIHLFISHTHRSCTSHSFTIRGGPTARAVKMSLFLFNEKYRFFPQFFDTLVYLSSCCKVKVK